MYYINQEFSHQILSANDDDDHRVTLEYTR